jgi:membrane associated rhomboid family serine protease
VNIWQEIKNKFKSGDSLIRLIFINVGIFVLIQILLLIQYVVSDSSPLQSNWFERLPEDFYLAGSSSLTEMLFRPWSLITHMLTHIQFGHFIFNMLALYTMGQIFVSAVGSKKIIGLYIMGGLSGFFLFALAYNFLNRFHQPEGSYVLGASAAVMAITVAAATLRPKQIIYLFGAFKLELVWLAAGLVLLDLASVREGVNSGGHIGHIGGAIFGYVYARQIQKGNDMASWMNFLIEKLKSIFSRKKMTVTPGYGRPKTDEQYNIEKREKQKRIDEILDKISRSGYESLTKEEKNFLFNNSQK